MRDGGRPDRRHVQGRNHAAVTEKVAALELDHKAGNVLRPGERWTVQAWLAHWLQEIEPHVKSTTFEGYERAVRVHLAPGVGAHRLTALRAEQLEHLYARMLTRITTRGTPMCRAAVHQVHRVVRQALNDAVRFGYLTSNPAAQARIPRGTDDSDAETEPFAVDKIQRLFLAAGEVRNGAGSSSPSRSDCGRAKP